jgi:hypothetical protein
MAYAGLPKGHYSGYLLFIGLVIGPLLYITVWQFQFIPLGDLPLHIYMAKIMANLADYKESYYIEWSLYPNQFWQWTLGFLQKIMPPILATKVLLTAHLISSTLGLYLLFCHFHQKLAQYPLNRAHPPLILSIFFCLQFNYFFQMGFLQFTLTAGLISYAMLLFMRFEGKAYSQSLIIFLLTPIFFLMHFMGCIAMFFSFMLWEVYRFDNNKLLPRFFAYLPGFILLAFLITQVPSAPHDGPLFSYIWLRKLSDLVLWYLRPFPIQGVLVLGLLFVAFPQIRSNLVSFKWTSNSLIALFIGALFFILAPSEIKRMADAELRLLYPLSVMITFILLNLILQETSRNKRMAIAIPLVLFCLSTFWYFSVLKSKESDLMQLREDYNLEGVPLLINYTKPECRLKQFLSPSGNTLFYLYAYFEYLQDLPGVHHIPFVFKTSVLRRTNKNHQTSRFYDYVLPWGTPVNAEVTKGKEVWLKKNLLILPVEGKDYYSKLLRKHDFITGKHWIIAVKKNIPKADPAHPCL